MEEYEHTSENLKKLLSNAIVGEITHLKLADWCYAWCQKYWEDDQSIEYNLGLKIAEEIDTQCELFLVNTHDHNELDKIDLTTVIMPHEWLLVWLDKLR